MTSVSDPHGQAARFGDRVGGIAPPSPGQHGGRSIEAGVGSRQRDARGAACLWRVPEGSIGDPAGRSRGRCGVLVGYEDRKLRHEHVLRPDVPAWVQSFNERKLPDADAGANVDGAIGAIPIRCGNSRPSAASTLYEAIYGSPYGNELLVEFAGELLNRERLGYATRPTCWRSASHRTTRLVIPTAPTRRRSGTSPFERIGRLAAC